VNDRRKEEGRRDPVNESTTLIAPSDAVKDRAIFDVVS